jgi:excisionase family DNA binding protein
VVEAIKKEVLIGSKLNLEKRRAGEALYQLGWSKMDIGYVLGITTGTVYDWHLGAVPSEDDGVTYYNLSEVAAITELAVSGIKELIKKKQLPFIKRGGRFLVSAEEVESLKRRRRKKGPWSQQPKTSNSNGNTPIKMGI